MSYEPPLLAVNTIAKDEAHNLPALLAPLRSVVDEWVLCDTGSSDDTIAIARSWGCKIVTDPWQDDFGHARNVARDATSARFILWLDADDRMDAVDVAKIRWMLASSPAHWGYFLQLESDNPDPRQKSSCGQGRIFPNLPQVRWKGRVHEQFVGGMNDNHWPLNNLPFVVRHTGYATNAAVQAKYARNIRILEREIAEGRATADIRFHLGQSLMGLGKTWESLQVFRALSKIDSTALFEQQIAARSATLAAQAINNLSLIERTKLVERGLSIQPDDDMVRVYLADCYMTANRRADCHETLRPIMERGHLLPSLMPYPIEFTKMLARQLWERSNGNQG